MVQRGTTNDSEWPFQLIFLFFQVREEPTTKHPKENSLNLEEVLWRRPIELRAEISTQGKILTVEAETAEVVRRFWSKEVFLKFFCNIHRKAPVLESPFKKVAGLEPRKSIKRRPQHRCFPVNIAKFLKNFFYKTTLVAASGIEI